MANLNTTYIKHSKILRCSDSLLLNQELVELVKEYGVTVNDFNARIALKRSVTVIGGGMSSERLVSYMSANGIVRSLLELDYEVIFIDMGADIATVLMLLQPEVVFNALHGTYGEDGCLPGLLNILRIPYTGCGVSASSLAFNKKKSYEIFRANNLLTISSIIVRKSHNMEQDLPSDPMPDPMPRPYVIKPLAQGSSIGVEIIFPEDNFSFADYQFPYGDEILVEQYISGREMQVAVLNGKALGALEIKLLKNKRFYDYEAKYTEGFTEHLLPAPIDSSYYNELLELAEYACKALACSGLIRVEFIFDKQKFYLLEVNTLPGMTPLSICPEIAAYCGISYTELVGRILNTAKFE